MQQTDDLTGVTTTSVETAEVLDASQASTFKVSTIQAFRPERWLGREVEPGDQLVLVDLTSDDGRQMRFVCRAAHAPKLYASVQLRIDWTPAP